MEFPAWCLIMACSVLLSLPSSDEKPTYRIQNNQHVVKMEMDIKDQNMKSMYAKYHPQNTLYNNDKERESYNQRDMYTHGEIYSEVKDLNQKDSTSRKYHSLGNLRWKKRKRKDNLDAVNNHITTSMISKIECGVCFFAVNLLHYEFEKKKSKEEIASTIEKLCETLHIDDQKVCHGIVQMFKEEVLTVFARLALNSSEVCGMIIGPQCAKSFSPVTMWNVTIPPRPKVPPQPCNMKSSLPPLKVLQLSDIHLDLQYENGSNAECGEPLCCRHGDKPVKGKPAGYWGDYRQCDTPLWTLHNLFQHLTTQQFDYILWTGDLPAHNVWKQNKTGQLKLMELLVEMFAKFFPKTPVFWALGNHEGVPVDSFPPSTEPDASMHWLYYSLAENWSHWLPKSSLPNIRKGAFYDVLVKPGFRIISLNMNYCNNLNFWLLVDVVDPDKELAWLISVLLHSERQGEKVHIIGHIPPNQCLPAWSWNYYRIVNRFWDTIAAQFFGHTHRDNFLVFHDEIATQQPIAMAYISPSITTYPGQNPAYRVYEVQADYPHSCKAVLNHHTYILNLTEANRSGKALWQLEYSAKEAYNLSSLSTADWSSLVWRMQHDNSLLQQYYRFHYKSHPPSPACDHSCAAGLLCEILEARSWDPSLCANITNGHTEYMYALEANRFNC